jgi:hypothetical protein
VFFSLPPPLDHSVGLDFSFSPSVLGPAVPPAVRKQELASHSLGFLPPQILPPENLVFLFGTQSSFPSVFSPVLVGLCATQIILCFRFPSRVCWFFLLKPSVLVFLAQRAVYRSSCLILFYFWAWIFKIRLCLLGSCLAPLFALWSPRRFPLCATEVSVPLGLGTCSKARPVSACLPRVRVRP